jgi:homoserine kinase type II
MTGPSARLLDLLGLRPGSVVTLKDVADGNGSWRVETLAGERLVLRRYHDTASPQDLEYEHAVLRHLASAGWVVPDAVGDVIRNDEAYYCLTRYVPGAAIGRESIEQRRRRGRDLARLHLALRGLGERVGQRHGWRAQHSGVTVHTGIDWRDCVRGLLEVSPRAGSWLESAAAEVRSALAAVGAGELPLMVVHGDFAEWNVHYAGGRLAGVVDFGLTHLDSRPYELALARTHRSPETADAYRAELARGGWALTEVEEAALEPLYRAFRVDVAVWLADHGRRTGAYNLAGIERQLARTGTAPA